MNPRSFSQREPTASTLSEAAAAIARQLDENVPENVARFHFTDEGLEALDDWEASVSGQVGRPLRFTRWREWTSRGHWRYVTMHRRASAFAILEEETYGATAITNRAAYVLRSRATARDNVRGRVARRRSRSTQRRR